VDGLRAQAITVWVGRAPNGAAIVSRRLCEAGPSQVVHGLPAPAV